MQIQSLKGLFEQPLRRPELMQGRELLRVMGTLMCSLLGSVLVFARKILMSVPHVKTINCDTLHTTKQMRTTFQNLTAA